jgi:capsular exopolysaccharide synthesis family protein
MDMDSMNSPNQSLAPEGPRQPLQPARRSQLPSVAVQLPEPPARDEDVIDLRELWAVLMRRRWLIISAVALAAILALVATFVMTPVYRSTLLLQIETEGNRVVDYGSVTPEEATGYRANMDFYRTQYELLKSNTLARRVIDQLGLAGPRAEEEETRSFANEMSAMVKSLISSMSGNRTADDVRQGVDPEQAVRMSEERALLAQLTVEPVRDSRLVRIHYDSPSPVEAAEVANAVAANFINLNLERRYDASSFAKRFLEEQLAQARATLEESEKRFVAYAREREIVDTDKRLEITLDKLREMNAQLIKAEGARIEAEAEYLGIVDAGGAGSAAGVLENKLIQSLKERRGTMEADYRDQLQVYKPNYPSMRQLKQQIGELDQQIARETSAIAGGVKAKYEAKSLEEAKLAQRILELNEEALALQDRSTDFETLKREVTTNRELYDGLLQRVKEVGVAAGIGENNISIVDAARVPIAPFKPSLKLNLAIAIALGGFIGVLAAFLLEALDDTVRGAEDVEGLVGAPVLTLIPKVNLRELGLQDEELGLLAFRDPKSAVAESVRSLRTQLLFSTADGAPDILHFTSGGPREGKTTTAINTAIAFAQAGNTVLMIDCDLRNPSLQRAFSLPNTKGLTNYLAGSAKPLEISQATMVTRLFTITSGPLPPNPVELLASAKMLDLLSVAAERFDIVIIDGPPVIGLADAIVLANLAKATIFIVDAEATHRREIASAVKRLRQANAHLLGAVLAKVGRAGKGYGYGYGYDYMYSYGGRGDQANLPQQSQA